MPYSNDTPIELFVMNTLMERQFQRIVDSWPIKLETIHQIVTKHFHDHGVHLVGPFEHGDEIKRQIVILLKHSPIIVEQIDKAKRQAAVNSQRGRNSAER